MARLQQFYKDKVVADLTEKFGYKSVKELPRLTKITLNMGVGEAIADKKVLEHAVSDLTKIAGQKPVTTKSRKAIAAFTAHGPFIALGADMAWLPRGIACDLSPTSCLRASAHPQPSSCSRSSSMPK